MGFVPVGPNTKVLVGSADLSAYFNSASHPAEVSVGRVTTFGKSAHCYIPVLKDGTISLGGFFDGAADAVDAKLAAALGAASTLITVGYDGLTAGAAVKIAQTVATNYEVAGEVDGVVEVSLEAQASETGIETGIALQPVVTTAGIFGTAVDNGAATTGGAYGYLHVLAVAGTSFDAYIQHSVDGVTWVDLAPLFTTATVPGAQRITIAGTVNRYLRSVGVGTGGTGTFAVAIVRR